jgi:hypothetical protein
MVYHMPKTVATPDLLLAAGSKSSWPPMDLSEKLLNLAEEQHAAWDSWKIFHPVPSHGKT